MENINSGTVPSENGLPLIMMEALENFYFDLKYIDTTSTNLSVGVLLTIHSELVVGLDIEYSTTPYALADLDEHVIAANTVCINFNRAILQNPTLTSNTTKELILQTIQSSTFMEALYQSWIASFFTIMRSGKDSDEKFAVIESLLSQEPLEFLFVYGYDLTPYTVTYNVN